MRTVGVDLSVDAPGTGVAVIDWEAGGDRLVESLVGADDAMLMTGPCLSRATDGSATAERL